MQETVCGAAEIGSVATQAVKWNRRSGSLTYSWPAYQINVTHSPSCELTADLQRGDETRSLINRRDAHGLIRQLPFNAAH